MKIKLLTFLLFLLPMTILPQKMSAEKLNVIVDTDCDMDDMMAILYLLKNKDVRVLAITTTGTGMVHWKYSAPNIKNLLKLAHHPGIPVSYGAKESLSPYSCFPDSWRKGVDEVFNIPMPKSRRRISPLPSWQLMAQEILRSQGKVSILALAPMTNIALALKNEPSIVKNIAQIVISGGSVDKGGNIVGKPRGIKNNCAEYNIFLDAKAAEDVIRSGVQIVLVPLNTTEDAPVTPTLYEAFKEIKRNPSANFVFEVIKPFVFSQKDTHIYLWDPVAAAVMTNPNIGAYKTMNISVNQRHGPTYGCTQEEKYGTPIVVYYRLDSAEFYALFYKTITRGG